MTTAILSAAEPAVLSTPVAAAATSSSLVGGRWWTNLNLPGTLIVTVVFSLSILLLNHIVVTTCDFRSGTEAKIIVLGLSCFVSLQIAFLAASIIGFPIASRYIMSIGMTMLGMAYLMLDE